MDRIGNLTSALPGEVCPRALWECLQLSGADVSEYAHETNTPEGREAGYQQWMRSGSVAEVVEAVRQLRADYDELAEA